MVKRLRNILALMLFLFATVNTQAIEQLNGVYQIATAQDMADFAALVTGGNSNIKGALTADIDLTGTDIRVKGTYNGVFDGQGHTVKVKYETNENCTALFTLLTSGGKVCNLHVDGSVTTDGKNAAGIVSTCKGGEISNCISTVDIYSTYQGDCTHGGVIAWANTNTSVFRNLVYCGKMVIENEGTRVAPLIGWFDDPTLTMENCVAIATIEIGNAEGSNIAVRYGSDTKNPNVKNVFCCVNGVTETKNNVEVVDEAQMKSGEVCYRVNGTQSVINFYQTLGVDDYPVPFSDGHKQVYATGSINCAGQATGTLQYNNTGGSALPDHQFQDGFCTVCDLMDENYLTPVDGYYELATGMDMKWFAQMVAKQNTLNARLVDDVDISDIDWTPIGTLNTYYAGTFDGQGHTVSGLNYLSTGQATGLFGYVYNGVVKNLKIEGQMTSSYSWTGSIGRVGGTSAISNVHSAVDVTANVASTICVGGLIGQIENNATVDRCTYSGKLTTDTETANPIMGGIVACVWTGANVSSITNCLFIGEVSGTRQGNYGGLVGRFNSTGCRVNHCLSAGVVSTTVSNPTQTSALLSWVAATASNITENYYLIESAPMVCGNGSGLSGIGVTTEQLASGEATWLLNDKSFVNPRFFQTLDYDEKPTLDAGHGIIYPKDEEYACIVEESDYADFLEYYIKNETKFIQTAVATQSILDSYASEIEKTADIETWEQFQEYYPTLKSLRNQADTSITKYQEYDKICQDVIEYMNNNATAGKEFATLKIYLTTNAAASESFENGTYLYIMQNHTLTNEEIAVEGEMVTTLFNQGLATNYLPGSEITSLLTDVKSSVVSTNKVPFADEQTITDLKDGIYALTTNAAFRVGDDAGNDFYAARVFLNDNINYISTLGTEDAPASANEFATAAEQGRYLNYVAVNVDKGQLSLGITNPGTGLASEQLYFTNYRLYYLGSEDDANEQLTPVLSDYVQRAQSIVSYTADDGFEFATYPNCSQELKDNLQNNIDAAGNATTGAAKMKLINTFSDLFKEVYECRKAYIAMGNAANKATEMVNSLVNDNVITDTEANPIYDDINEIWNAYSEGSVSTEEAKALTDKIAQGGGIYPVQDEDGYYQIANPVHLIVFASMVTNGDVKINAKLVNDIDLEGSSFDVIGQHHYNTNYSFAGIFDGQGHTISNLNIDAATGWVGLFGTLYGTARNFNITGSIEVNQKSQYVGAVAGYLAGGTLENVHSSVNVTLNAGSTGTLHVGGLTGDARNSAKVIGCSSSGTIYAADCTDCFGGLVGYTNSVVIKDCMFTGVVKANEDNAGYAFGGILAYANTTSLDIENNLMVGSVLPEKGAAVIGTFRSAVPGTYRNNYFLEGSGVKGFGSDVAMTGVEAQTISATAEQLASGEVAYKLNGDQKAIYYYQTISEDAVPVLDATHSQVYAVSHYSCYGEALGAITYSNHDTSVRDEHSYVDGACGVCGITPAGDYKIGNKDQFIIFANKVNEGSANQNSAELTADIDLQDVVWTPIGSSANKFMGIFDGKGHHISNFSYTTKGQGEGLFGFVRDGEVKNFSLDGNLQTAYSWTGLIGDAQGAANICNINSALDITATVKATICVGGVVGQTENNASVERCTYSGTINFDEENANPIAGGIVGCVWTVNNNSSITNCLFTGTIKGSRVGNYGGFVGRFNGVACKVSHNISAGSVIAAAGATQASVFCSWCAGTAANVTENYYLIESAPAVNADKNLDAGCTGVTAEQLASGEICYLLNASQADTYWFQTLGTDATPVLDATHKTVIKHEDGTYGNSDEDAIQEVESDATPVTDQGIYTLSGQRVVKPQHGLYIINGKKIMIK